MSGDFAITRQMKGGLSADRRWRFHDFLKPGLESFPGEAAAA
jgi:hypothetical protein